MNNAQFMENLCRHWGEFGTKSAVEHAGQTLSYEQLAQKVKKLTKRLPEADHYIVKMDKSIGYIITILACFQKGIPFTPCAPDIPNNRVDFIRNQLDGDVVLLDDIETLMVQSPQENAFITNERAYVIYTSGSTGTPKGVKVLFKGVDNIINEQVKHFNLTSSSRFMWLLSQNFDASFSDILTALKSGTTLVIPDEPTDKILHKQQFETLFNQQRITHSDIPPSVLKWLSPDRFTTLETIVVGGELCDRDMLKRFYDSGVQPIVVYGPTETTICSSLAYYNENYFEKSIGTPVNNTVFQIVNKNNEVLSEAESGELLIGGVGVCDGYVDNTLNENKFTTLNNECYFKTGDWVVQKEGVYYFEGRVDRQFKHAGQLICPEEIETELLKMAEITNASVHYVNGKIRASIESTAPVDEQTIKTSLANDLPHYMIPYTITSEQSLLKNANDKVDHKTIALDNIEKLLIEAFEKVLGKSVVDKETPFSEMGGDSLAFMELIMEIEDYGFSVNIDAIAENASVKNIAQQIHNETNNHKTPAQLIEWLPPKNEIKPDTKKQPSKDDAAKTVLMTGANGFLGVHLLDNLQKSTAVFKIICLMRGQSHDHCWDKLRAKANEQQVVLNESKIVVLKGDLSRNNLGIKHSLYEWLTNNVDEIVHSAAQVNNIKPFEALFESNVISLVHLIKLANKGKQKTIHNMSSLSVFVSSKDVPSQLHESRKLTKHDSELYTGYAQSKWLSEYLLQYVIKKGGLAINYRLGLLGPSLKHPVFDASNFTYQVLKDVMTFKQAPAESAHCCFDITPVDLASQIISDIITKGGGQFVYHITSDESISIGDVISAVNGELIDSFSAWQTKNQQSVLNRHLYECHGKWPEFNIFETTRVESFNPSLPVNSDKMLYLETYLHSISEGERS